ncbi:helix-turn-helix domain-containing protein [Flagellimonas sp. S174]|uniref:helix-turn-helix domain-containing protein n=1 Tax=Flagellimonas sp. S174 TaxID=3410790 RepID=UPI003BF4F94F
MSEESFISAIVGITTFISLFLAFFLVTVKTKNRLSNRLFAFFLVLIVIDLSSFLFGSQSESVSNLGLLRNLAVFLQPPTLYLYILSACFVDFKLQPKHALHLVPFILVNLVFFPRFYLQSQEEKLLFLQDFRSTFEIQFNHIFFHIQVTAYLVACFLVLKKVKRLYLENYAGANIKSYYWLFQLTIAISVFYALALAKNVFKFSVFDTFSEGIRIGLFVLQFIIICWYLFKALNHPDLFRNLNSRLQLVEVLLSEQKKEDDNQSKGQDELLRLKKYMSEEKPFLNPALTIQTLSDEIGIPARELSILINHKMGQHFFDFINSYRIQSAVDILKDPSKKKVTILEILYEVGFNSKSSFNTAFKKHTGSTPTSYRLKNS